MFALGDKTPLHGILYSLIPGLHRARWPSGALFLTCLCIAVFASAGLDRILHSRERLLTRAASRGWLGFGAVLAATVTWLTWTGNTLEPRLGLAAVIAPATGAVLAASISSRATAAALGLLLFAELSANAGIVSAPAWDPGRNQWWLALRGGEKRRSIPEEPARTVSRGGSRLDRSELGKLARHRNVARLSPRDQPEALRDSVE